MYVGRTAASYLRDYDRDQPWFCWVSFTGPHEPWDSPEPYATRYRAADMPPPVPPMVSAGPRPTGVLDSRLARRPPIDTAEIAAIRADYAGNVTLIDDQVGHLLRVVSDRGEMDRTVVALVSDHGEMYGDHGLLFKGVFLAGASRIPFIVRTPETAAALKSGGTSDQPVELIDLGPTLVELAGGRPGSSGYGRSLVPVLDDLSTPHRTDALVEIHGEVMVATREWKLALNRAGATYLLFDLAGDSSETTNLAGVPAYRDVQGSLERRLLTRLVESLP